MEALDRLSRRFVPVRSGTGDRPRVLRLAPARLDVVLARSPFRPYRRGAQTDGDLDGSVNPLLQRNQGEVFVDGATAAIQAGVLLRAGPLAGALTPRAYVGLPRGPDGGELDGSVASAYARAVLGPVALDAGRNNVTIGFGMDGGPMLSDNARGQDMIRLALDRPVRLPGFLRRLGLWGASLAFSDLGDDRDVPGSILTLIRVSGRPGSRVEFGINSLNVQGGEGAPVASLHDRLIDIFRPWQNTRFINISDKVVGADLRIAMPELRSAVFVNFMTTDDRGRFRQPACGCWEDAVWLAGVEALGLGAEGRTDLRVEWRHAGARAHTHHQFSSGTTLDGRVFGDALGPNAAGVSASLHRAGSASRLGIVGAWERYSGDDYYWARVPGGGEWDYDWYRAADNPDEIRKRVVVDYLRSNGLRRLVTSIRLGYERVTRFAYTDRSRDNLLARVTLQYLP
jgi:hypothetical protein